MRRHSILAVAMLVACSTPHERIEQASASASGGIGPSDDDDGVPSDDEGDADDEGDTGDRLDVGAGESGSDDACPDSDGGGAGGIPAGEFSYIWIANSAEGTVSKIDTKDGAELGRYRTAPGSTPNPSRTSVNLYGDVAVMNRQVPSVTKIAAREADCIGPSTSSGPDDVKPWGEDACVLWHTELGASGLYEDGPRPVAWEGGTDGGCTKNPRLWVGWGDMASATGTFQRLDGATGEVLDEVVVTGWETSVAPIGPYGGAVARDGSFWVAGLGGPLVHIDGTTLDVTYLPRPANSYFYGIALDAAGNPWLGDLAGVTWTYFVGAQSFRQNATAGARGRGIAVDREGRVWMPVHANPNPVAGACSLAQIDGITGTVQRDIALPGCVEPVGVAVDVDGAIWIVDKGAQQAFKIDPDSGELLLSVGGLVQPYTYSDMTGSGLDLVVNPPAG